MWEILLFIVFVFWLANHVSTTVAGLVVIGGIVVFLLIGHAVEKAEWEARCNWVHHWRKRR